MQNSTVANNYVNDLTSGGGGIKKAVAATVQNCIVYHNMKGVFQNDIAPSVDNVSYSCAIELSPTNGNTSLDPQFVAAGSSDFHLLPGSPCIDTGTNLVSVTTDLDGLSRPIDGDNVAATNHDMGCYEAIPVTSGVLRCSFVESTNAGLGSVLVVFTSYVAGSNTSSLYYYWDFNNDGTNDLEGAGLAVVTNNYADAGNYTVSLLVSNAISETCSQLKTDMIRVSPSVMYIDLSGSHTQPYSSWVTAATNFVDPLALAADTVTIRVNDGIYNIAPMLIADQITMRSENGPSLTTLKVSVNDRVIDVVAAGVVIDGFTITGGNVIGGSGGAIRMTDGTVRNCVIVSNRAASSSQGGAIYASGDSLIEDCTFYANQGGHYSGGIRLNGANALVRDCVLSNNYCNIWGGGMYVSAGTVRNSLIVHNYITGNHSTYGGGGVLLGAGARLENCTVAHNSIPALSPGGGVRYTGDYITNCIVYYNTQGGTPNNIEAASYDDVGNSCATELPNGARGNTTAAPMFVDTNASDYTLMGSSPCKDGGISMPWMTNNVLDLVGNTRVRNIVDMGCYEWTPPGGTVIVIR